jgi:hypothetical protein
LLEVTLITYFVSLEIRLLRFFDVLKVSEEKLIPVFACCEAHFFLDKFSIIILIKVFVGTKESLIILRRELSSINLIEIQDFICFIRIGDTEALCHVFGIEISTGQVLLSVWVKEISAFVIVLFLEIEDT